MHSPSVPHHSWAMDSVHSPQDSNNKLGGQAVNSPCPSMEDPSATHRRRELARMVEAGFYFFGVADLESFEGLLDDAQQRAMLRDWLRSEHVLRGAADGAADHGTQTAAVNMVDVSTAAAPTTREVGSMATFSPSGARLVSAGSQTTVVRVAQRASQANVAAPVADAAVAAAASMADAQTTTRGFVQTADASTSHYLVPGIGLTAAATQTALNVTALEDSLESALSAFDGSHAAQRALEQRVAELESQLANNVQNADASTQTELDLDGLFGLEDGLLQAALGAQDAPEEQQEWLESEILIIDENSYWQKDSEGTWREREGQPSV